MATSGPVHVNLQCEHFAAVTLYPVRKLEIKKTNVFSVFDRGASNSPNDIYLLVLRSNQAGANAD